MDQPTNLVILCTDEMRGDCLGANGMNRDIRTPNMDRLAARGVNFSRHFSTFPKCVPARVSMMTGRYCHTDGYRNIFQHLPADQLDVLRTLLDRGYQAALFGKNHCWENLHEASHTPSELAEGKRGLRIDHHSWTRSFRDIYDRRRVAAPTGEQVRRCNLDRPLTADLDYRGDVDLHWADDAYTEQAIRFLTQVRERGQPFFMQVNIEAPHPYYAAPEPWYSMYDPDAIEAYVHELPNAAPLSLVKQRELRTGLHADPRLLRKMQAVYYGMISRVDAQMGRIISALEAEGLWEQTLIVLWSDHGDFAGQYGLGEKWDTTFADCLTHVPCVLAGGGIPAGRRITALSDHTDLAPTFLSLFGMEPTWGIHGHDLTPLITGASTAARDAVFADGGHETEMRRRFSFASHDEGKQRTYRRCPDTMARAKMVRTSRHKLIMRETGDHELYDLETDRLEMNNRWTDASLTAVRLDLMERLTQWSLRTDTDRPRQTEVGA